MQRLDYRALFLINRARPVPVPVRHDAGATPPRLTPPRAANA